MIRMADFLRRFHSSYSYIERLSDEITEHEKKTLIPIAFVMFLH